MCPLAMLLAALCPLGIQESALNAEPLPSFGERFESALADEDLERVEALVRSNKIYFLAQFLGYQKVWLGVEGEPSSDELQALECARQLAEAVDSALGHPGLLRQFEFLDALDASGRRDRQNAVALRDQAEGRWKDQEYSRATQLLERSIAILRALGDAAELSDVLTLLVAWRQEMGQYREAVALHKEVVQLLHSFGHPIAIAVAYLNEGSSLALLGHYEAAVESFRTCLQFARPYDHTIAVAAALSSMGSSLRSLGRFLEALDALTEAVRLLESLGDQQPLAEALANLGLCYRALGEFDKAVQSHERAVALLESAGSSASRASSLNNLGQSYLALGELDRALPVLERALVLREALPNPLDLADSLAGLGRCLLALAQFDKALSLFLQCLAIQKEYGSSEDLAHGLSVVGGCYHSMGQRELAISYLQQSLAIENSSLNPQHLAVGLDLLGSCYSQEGDYEKALECLQRSLEIKESIGNQQEVALTLDHLGSYHSARDNLPLALDFYQRATNLHRKLGNSMWTAMSLQHVGSCYARMGRYEQAIDLHRQAAATLHRVPLKSLTDRDRAAFERPWEALLEDVSCLAWKSPDGSPALADAFWVQEAMRCRSLLGRLGEREAQVLSSSDPQLLARHTELMGRLKDLRLRLRQRRPPPRPDVDDLQKTLQSTEDEFAELTRQLRRENPALMELTRPQASELSDIQELLLSEDRALLSFVLAEPNSYLWVVTRERLEVFSLAPESQVRAVHQELMQALAADHVRDLAFVDPARKLFQMLLEAAQELLQPYSEWIVIPHGFLGYLPFEVLLSEELPAKSSVDLADLPYVLQNRTLRYAPSGSFLAFLARQSRPSKKWEKDALLLGDPLYQQERTLKHRLRSRRVLDPARFARLRLTREEVTAIAAELLGESESSLFLDLRDLPRSGSVHGSRFDLFVGEDVNASRLQGNLEGYRILHLATHGYFDPEFPWFSGLVLSDTEEHDPAAPFLNLLEIGCLKIDAEIVFLSACETGRGEVLRSEGIQSAARSFLLAGAQSVVATQWKVRDDVASVLARSFYRQLFKGTPPAEALRRAKFFLLHGGHPERGVTSLDHEEAVRNLHAHPSEWAAFVLMGGLE